MNKYKVRTPIKNITLSEQTRHLTPIGQNDRRKQKKSRKILKIIHTKNDDNPEKAYPFLSPPRQQHLPSSSKKPITQVNLFKARPIEIKERKDAPSC